jgi:histidyl-tRNA synthetase
MTGKYQHWKIGQDQEAHNGVTKVNLINLQQLTEDSKMKLQMAKGVRDVSPEDKILKNQVLSTLQGVFELYGFPPLETPLLERWETLTAKGGAGQDSDAFKEIFKLVDQGNRKLGLRFDLTVPLARYVALDPSLKLPFKRYEVGRVYRDGPIKLGRYREFWQCDIDIVGTRSMLADAEIIAMVDASFSKLGLDVVIKVNNRKILNGLLAQSGIKEKESAIIAIDKLAKIGRDGVTSELKDRGYTKKQIDNFFSLLSEKNTLSQLKKVISDPEGKEGIAELEEVFKYCKGLGLKSVKFDVSLARGLAYYTGTVFEAFLKKGKITSSLAGGGRYDGLVSQLGRRDVPAMGISFGLEPIMDTLKLLGKQTVKTKSQVYVIPIGTVDESLKVASLLRTAGIATDFSLGKKGVSKNLQYANALGIPFAIIIGEKELAKKKVTLRDMESGEEKMMTVEQVIKKLQ